MEPEYLEIVDTMNRLYAGFPAWRVDSDALTRVLDLVAPWPPARIGTLRYVFSRDPAQDAAAWTAPPGPLSRFRAPRDPLPFLLPQYPDLGRILICSRNGRYREMGLKLLPVPRNAIELAALIWRLDEWHEPTRLLAEDRLAGMIARIPPDAVAEVAVTLLPVIENFWRLSRRGRELWRALLAQDGVRAALVERLVVAQGAGMRQVFLRLMRDPGMDAHLPRLSREAAHPTIRKRALGWLMEGHVWYDGPTIYNRAADRRVAAVTRRPLAVAADVPAAIRAGAADRSIKVRKAVAEALPRAIPAAPAAARAAAQLLARDRNPGVRARAEWFLQHRAEA